MTTLETTTALLGFGLAAAIMWLLRRDHLHLSHGLFWLCIAVAAAALGIWPGIVDRVAWLTGINYPPTLLLVTSVIVLLVKTLHTDILNTRIERQVKRLNQRLALYEMRQEETESSTPQD
jgi:hypothetical protein